MIRKKQQRKIEKREKDLIQKKKQETSTLQQYTDKYINITLFADVLPKEGRDSLLNFSISNIENHRDTLTKYIHLEVATSTIQISATTNHRRTPSLRWNVYKLRWHQTWLSLVKRGCRTVQIPCVVYTPGCSSSHSCDKILQLCPVLGRKLQQAR